MRDLRQETGHRQLRLPLQPEDKATLVTQPAEDQHYAGRKKGQGVCLHQMYEGRENC